MSSQPITASPDAQGLLPGPDRSHRAAHFYSLLNRQKINLKRRWWIVVVGMGVALGLAAAYFKYAPPSYFSVGSMIVSIKLNIPQKSTYAEELNTFVGTQTALMESDVVTSRAHARLVSTNSAWTNQSVKLRVSVVPKASIFKLRGKGSDPEYTQLFVQTCMEEYSKLKKEMITETSDSTLLGMQAEVARLEKELRTRDEAVVSFQTTNDIVFLQDQGYAAMFSLMVNFYQKLADLASELQLLEKLSLEQNLERERQFAIASMLGLSQPGSGVSSGIYASELELIKVKQFIVLLKARQQEMGAYLRPKHPQMIELDEEIARQENLAAVYRKQTQENIDNKKHSLELQIADIKQVLGQWESKSLVASRAKNDFERIKSDFHRTQTLYDRMLENIEVVTAGKETVQESVTIMEEASEAQADRVGPIKGLVLAAFLGLVGSIGLLFFLERLDDRMMSFLELQELFDEEILAQIPRERCDRKTREVALLKPEDVRHSFVESFRSLRSSLMFVANPRPRTLLVTSSIPNDGKSMTAANLAVTIANAGSKVLLVDADLRKGTQHRKFNIEAEPGLSDLLAKGLDVTNVIRSTPVPGLSVLPRGAMTHNSSELFLRESLEKFLKEISSQYDYVILDSPPVMAADDVCCLAPYADGVLFLMRAEHTSARVARAALNVLYQRKVRVLGIVFNAVRASSGEYYYYGYKDYYAKYPSA